jgi:hypothetical protein
MLARRWSGRDDPVRRLDRPQLSRVSVSVDRGVQAAKYSSGPPGVAITTVVAEPSMDRKHAERLRGRSTNDADSAWNLSSPHCTSSAPART